MVRKIMVEMFLLFEMSLKNGTQQDYSHPILFQRHFKHMQHHWQKEHHKKLLSVKYTVKELNATVKELMIWNIIMFNSFLH